MTYLIGYLVIGTLWSVSLWYVSGRHTAHEKWVNQIAWAASTLLWPLYFVAFVVMMIQIKRGRTK